MTTPTIAVSAPWFDTALAASNFAGESTKPIVLPKPEAAHYAGPSTSTDDAEVFMNAFIDADILPAHRRHRMRLALSTVGGLLLSGLVIGSPAPAVSARQPESRTIYVTALDRDGRPVTDLQAADFALKVGNKPLEVIRAEPAQAPLRIAIIVSDAGTGGFQQGLATFMQKLLGRAEFSLISVIVQPESVVDYASPKRACSRRRPAPPRTRADGKRGAQLMEAIQDGDETRPARRHGVPVILVSRVGAEATTPIPGDDVARTAAAERRASCTSCPRLARNGSTVVERGPGISTEQAQSRMPTPPTARSTSAQVLGDGAEGFGRPSRPGHLDHAGAGAGAGGRRAPEPVRDQCALPPGVKATTSCRSHRRARASKLQAPRVFCSRRFDIRRSAAIMSFAAATVSFGGLP